MKNSKVQQRHIVDVLFVLALFCVFAASALMLVLLGSDIYQTTVQNMDQNYNSRTAFSYVTEKILQQDHTDAISVTTFGDGSAIALQQDIDEESYVTYLYLDQGYLKELLTKTGNSLSPNAGQSILECSSFDVTAVNADLYHVTLETTQGEDASLYIHTKSSSN